MSKPTKEIIEASQKLYDLGVRKEPEAGDRFVCADGDMRIYADEQKDWVADYAVVIPPLEWCLEWLRTEVGYLSLIGNMESGGYWLCDTLTPGITTGGSIPLVAVLKAIIAVAKEKQ